MEQQEHPLIKIPTIIFPKDLYRAFKKQARAAYPLEHIEAVAGQYQPWSNTVHIHALLDMAHRRHPDGGGLSLVEEEDNEYNEIEFCRKWAEELGYMFLGTIHTHPGDTTCKAMSTTDHYNGWADRELISGVLHLYKVGQEPTGNHKDHRRWYSRLAWWIPQREIQTVFV